MDLKIAAITRINEDENNYRCTCYFDGPLHEIVDFIAESSVTESKEEQSENGKKE
jgi:hypothetical protein